MESALSGVVCLPVRSEKARECCKHSGLVAGITVKGYSMPTPTVYRHGLKLGCGNPNARPPERTIVTGWSAHSIRRNVDFLYSVDERGLEPLSGLALTLTVRRCPESPPEWQRMRVAFEKVIRRMSLDLGHWVTEWQRRAVPHLHMALYWQPQDLPAASDLIRQWLRIAAPYGASYRGQYVHRIYDALGWNQYVSKHAARGLHHYQRNPQNIPPGWRHQSTGRMWGKLGKWPIVEPVRFDIDQLAFWRFRRVVRGWRLADARKPVQLPYALQAASGEVEWINPRRVRAARRMLRCPDPRLSAVRGLSEWMGQDVSLRVIQWLANDGAEVLSV